MSESGPFCVEFDEDLSALLDGELDDDRAGIVRDHVASCANCAARLMSFAQATAALHGERGTSIGNPVSLPPLRVSPPSRVRRAPSRRVLLRARLAIPLALAAAAAFALALRWRPSTLPLASPVAPTVIAREEVAAESGAAAVAQQKAAPAPAPVAPTAPPRDPLDSASDDELAIADELDTAEDLDLIEHLEALEALAAREAS
jgi:anti-sigma factor RsiW